MHPAASHACDDETQYSVKPASVRKGASSSRASSSSSASSSSGEEKFAFSAFESADDTSDEDQDALFWSDPSAVGVLRDEASWAGSLPASQGLYDNSEEKDGCGVGL